MSTYHKTKYIHVLLPDVVILHVRLLHQGRELCQYLLKLLSEKGSTLKRKKNAPKSNKFFPFIADPF